MAMNWQNKLNNVKFQIITYGNISWYPFLITKFEKNIEFNGTQYDYIGKPGSFFVRKQPKGRSFPLEFAFQGEANQDDAYLFEQASRNSSSAWTIIHPFYGKILCHPLSLMMDSSGLNSTVIKCQVIETTVPTNQKYNVPSRVKVENLALLVNKNALALLKTSPINLHINAKDLQKAVKQTTIVGNIVSTVTKLDSEYKSYKKFISVATNELNNYSAITETYLTSIQSLISLPSIVASNIGSRINCLESLLTSTYNSILGVSKPTYFQNIFYNLLGVICVSKIASSLTVQNAGDFQTRSDVLFYINKLQADYGSFLTGLAGLEDVDYTPDHDLMFSLNEQVNNTCFYLYSILFEAKQERTFYCDKDTNVILLAHRFYGLASEENIKTIKENNKIGISELFNIKKNRAILYYV